MLQCDRQDLQVQSTKAKVPLAGVAVCALEVGATGLGLGVDVPGATALVSHQGEVAMAGDVLNELRIRLDRTESVWNRERGSAQRGEGLRNGGVLGGGEMER